MAKKPKSSASKISAEKASTPAVITTPVRNTTVPPKTAAVVAAPAKKTAITHDTIATRAYFIWRSTGGGAFENWIRAERELSVL